MKPYSKIQKIVLGADQTEIVSKAAVFIFFRIFGLLMGYIFTIVVTRYFGSSVYGLVVLSFTIFMVLSIIGKLGFDITLTRFVASGEYSKNEISGYLGRATVYSFIASSLISVPLLVFNSWIAIEIFRKPEFASYIFWSAITFPFWSLILIHTGLYRGLKKNTLYSFFNTFGRFSFAVALLTMVIVLSSNVNDETPIIIHFITILILFLSCCWVSYGRLKYAFWKPIKTSFGIFAKVSRPILFTSVIFILLSWIDRIFIGVYLEESDVAIYDVSAKLALLVSFNLDAVNSILAPKIVELYKKNNRIELQNTLTFSANVSSVLSFIIFLFILFFNKWLLGLFGSEYIQGSLVLIILCIGQLSNCFSGSVGTLLQMTNNQKTYQKIMLAGLVLNLLLNFILVRDFGIEGVAFATFASMLFWNLLGIYYNNAILKLRTHLIIKRIFSNKKENA